MKSKPYFDPLRKFLSTSKYPKESYESLEKYCKSLMEFFNIFVGLHKKNQKPVNEYREF